MLETEHLRSEISSISDTLPLDGHRNQDRLSKADRETIAQFRHCLTAKVPIVDLYLFGSRARGDAEPDSDFDMFIVLDVNTPNCLPELRQQIDDVAWEVGFEKNRIISTIVTTPYQLKYGAMGANPLIQQIEQEGIRI